MKKSIHLFVLVFIFLISCLSSEAQSPKREMRSVWLATVWQLDWPSITVPKATGSNEPARQAAINQQKNELKVIFDSLKKANMNAVFFQVRGMCDAMYTSSYEPWSAYISSERGANPGYDPLSFAIEEAHKRGLELHAWLNPYRYSSSVYSHGNTSIDYANTHPEWLLDYGDYVKILNPGLPEVRERIKCIIGEIVNNYNVDGIVFDDYFYAYGGTPDNLDAAAQALYKPENQSIGDWRRENVNKMIAGVYDTIQNVKPYVTFGVSPFGTWTTDQNVAAQRGIPLPIGIGTTGNMYAEIYCDPVAWLEQGTVDYLSPQLYWTTYSAYPYGILAEWWSKLTNRFGKHFYSSHSLSSMTASSAPAASRIKINNEETPISALSTLELELFQAKKAPLFSAAPSAVNFLSSEIGLQIDFNRDYDINDAPGSVFYAASKFMNTTGFISYLRTQKFSLPALCPAIGWKTHADLPLVSNLTISENIVSWAYENDNVCYAVYAVPNENRNIPGIFTSSNYLLGVSYNKQFIFPANISESTHKIAVSVVDRYGNEGSPRIYGESLAPSTAAPLVYPENNTETVIPCIFQWETVQEADSYIWQLAEDEQFTNLVCSRQTKDNSFFSGKQTNLKDNTRYYWRVKTLKANAEEVWSETRSFISHKFKILSPANGNTNVSLLPAFKWDSISPTASYTLEISSVWNFLETKRIFITTVNTTSFVVPYGTLIGGTKYYARVMVNDGNISAVTESVSFTTIQETIPVPQILQPIDGSNIQGTSIQICWAEQPARGFRVELSTSSTFPPRSTTVKTVDAYTYCTIYEQLTNNTYYIRVKATTPDGLTEASDTVMVILKDNTSIGNNTITANWKGYFQKNDKNIYLVLNAPTSEKVRVKMYSITGTLLLQKEETLQEGINRIPIPTGKLLQGIYPLEITGEKNRLILKLIY